MNSSQPKLLFYFGSGRTFSTIDSNGMQVLRATGSGVAFRSAKRERSLTERALTLQSNCGKAQSLRIFAKGNSAVILSRDRGDNI